MAEWKRPDEVMQLHAQKLRRRALQARMNKTAVAENKPISENDLFSRSFNNVPTATSQKRKNPFGKDSSNKKTKESPPLDLDTSNDDTRFEVFEIKSEKPRVTSKSQPQLDFRSVLAKLERGEVLPEPEPRKGEDYFPIDWTLNTKMRFMSPKPFPWSGKLKTSEEASGTTGFVRCLDIREEESTLDTSPNAQFHQCCLIWQHPSIPWLDLFPRSVGKVSASLASNSLVATNQSVKDALHKEWRESFRSLFHLVRARQCPYFYVCTNTFTALFRAAGICGLSEVNASITPTTRGFRQALKQDEIVYAMPLRGDGKRRSDTTDSGCDTTDTTSSSILADVSNQGDKFVDGQGDKFADGTVNEDEEPQDKWMLDMGFEHNMIKSISSSQSRIALEKESEVDNLKQSLVFVKGVEAQALFNFLLNCKSVTTVAGALAGIPPTLLAPVAFHGAVLKSLKVKESVIRSEKDKFYSLELKGPLLPHVLPSLCFMLKSSQMEKYSVSCARLETTTSFSIAKQGQEESEPEDEPANQSAFSLENLSDCGFNKELLGHFCHSKQDRIECVESLEFSDNSYTWL